MQASLTILVGTMTGTADIVAEDVRDALAGQGVAATIRSMSDLDAAVFQPGETYLICTSTYGQGDVPDNARDFFAALEKARPDLTGVSFCVMGLGDSTYRETFCFGGKRFQALLTELGATLLGEPFYHDAAEGSMPEEEAVAWAGGWVSEAGILKDAA